MNLITLDYIENITIHPGVSPIRNFHSILQLRQGLVMLYKSMLQLETNYWETRYPNESPEKIEIFKKASFSMSGELNDADSSGMNLCFWYSVNLLNYAKCCGLVQFIKIKRILPEALANNKPLINELRDFQKNYIDSVSELTPIKHFRDKAGAHIAFTDPKEAHDNPATLIESLSLIPCIVNGRFTIGLMPRGKGPHVSSFGEHPWSLTENFERIFPRYFGK